ncbi:pectin acetylesterase, partial [Trifolium medium]|nr:pectin acetylesterase [Trifolium medium]
PPTVVKKSFADAVNNVCDIPTSQLPLPVVKGNNIAISMPEDEYQVGLATLKHNLHGRIIWTKGSTPLKVGDLKAKLSPLWKSLGKWGLTSL